MNFTFTTLKGSQRQGRGTMTTLRLAHLILTGLQEVDFETTRFNFSSSMGALGQVVGETIEQFPQQPNETQCSESIVCTSQLCIMQNQLSLSLLNLYNAVSSAQTGGNVIMGSFIKRVEQSLPNMQCAFSTASPSNFQSSVTLRSKKEYSSTNINRNWRAGVTEVFTQNAQTALDSMMRKIEDTCVDLERRCEDVEGPLRVVEEERDRYVQENEQLRLRNKELDDQLKQKADEVENARRQSSEHLTEFGHEHTRLEQLLQDQYVYRDELTASIESVRAELLEQQQSSERAIVAEREKARSTELEMMATLTEKDDQMEDLQEENRDLQRRSERTSQTLAQALKDNDTSREALSSLKLELAGATQSLEQSSLLLALKNDDISRLLAQEEDLRKALGPLKTMVSF
jgi:regulator of replication initiation timing